jgi:hypothetical protein
MDLPNAPFYRRWSFTLAGVIGLAAIPALLGRRGLQDTDSPAATTTLPPTTGTSGTRTFTRGGFGHLLVGPVCRRWRVTVLPG